MKNVIYLVEELREEQLLVAQVILIWAHLDKRFKNYRVRFIPPNQTILNEFKLTFYNNTGFTFNNISIFIHF